MELSTEQQIFDILGKAKKVLIALPESLTPDSVASGLALALFLRKLEKDVEVASSGPLPEGLKFLPGADTIKVDIGEGNSLVVTVDTSVKKLDEISYQTTDDKVHIYLKAKTGHLTADDVSFSEENFPVDAIVTLECRSLGELGGLFERHSELFYNAPKVNIDNRAGNEYFGAVNLVDITASSVAEILSSLLEKYEAALLDEDIATCLLTGIITKTNSFQHAQTTPRAFLKASELVSLGGRQQEVIKNVYKSKSLPLLRLWGRALARLRLPENLPIAYSMLNANDFLKAEASETDLPGVLKEMLSNVSGYKVVAVLSELPAGGTRLLAAVHLDIDAEGFRQKLGGEGRVTEYQAAPFKIVDVRLGQDLARAEDGLLEAAKLASSK